MSAFKVYCPNCDREISASDINIAQMVGKCTGCNQIFPISNPAQSDDRDDTRAPSRPSGIEHETGVTGELFLKRSWFHPALYFLLFFCIAWDGFLIFWYSMAVFGGPAQGGFGWLMILFPICHVAVGVGLTYSVLAGFLNKTEVLLTADSLYVRHRPVPWRGNRSLRRDEVLEIELEFGGFNTSAGSGGSLMQKIVSVHHTDGRQIVLLSGLPERQADYIAWHLANELQVPLVRKAGGMAVTGVGTTPMPRWMNRFMGGSDA